MLSSIDLPEASIPQLARPESSHAWTVTIPRRSITGDLVRDRMWRWLDGRRWQYRPITECGGC
jgi:hypothetical protein